MANGPYAGIDFYSDIAGAAIANTVTETDLFDVDPNYGKGYWKPGKMARFRVWGTYSTTGTPTLIFKVRGSAGGITGTVLATSGTLTTGSGVATQLWVVEGTTLCTVSGTSGAFYTHIEARIYAASGLTLTSAANTTTPGTSVSLDTSAAQAFSVTQLWGSQSSSNTMTRVGYIWESIG